MKKLLLAVVLATVLIISGCTTTQRDAVEPSAVPVAPEAPSSSELHTSESSSSDPTPSASSTDSSSVERLGNAVKDKYDGIEITAEVLERKAILPGSAIPVTVTVKNAGDKTVTYIQGSGSYETPEAVFMTVDGLQTVIPKDHLGQVTLDFVIKELKSGEELRYVLYVMAIEPNEKFDDYTYEAYMNEGKYIAETDWTEPQKTYPGLVSAASGTYQGHAYFLYYAQEESAVDLTVTPDGYAEYEFKIGVS